MTTVGTALSVSPPSRVSSCRDSVPELEQRLSMYSSTLNASPSMAVSVAALSMLGQ